MQGTVLARLPGCNTAGLNFFVRSQAVRAKAISRIYAKTTAAPARGACRLIRMRTCKSRSVIARPHSDSINWYQARFAVNESFRALIGVDFRNLWRAYAWPFPVPAR